MPGGRNLDISGSEMESTSSLGPYSSSAAQKHWTELSTQPDFSEDFTLSGITLPRNLDPWDIGIDTRSEQPNSRPESPLENDVPQVSLGDMSTVFPEAKGLSEDELGLSVDELDMKQFLLGDPLWCSASIEEQSSRKRTYSDTLSLPEQWALENCLENWLPALNETDVPCPAFSIQFEEDGGAPVAKMPRTEASSNHRHHLVDHRHYCRMSPENDGMYAENIRDNDYWASCLFDYDSDTDMTAASPADIVMEPRHHQSQTSTSKPAISNAAGVVRDVPPIGVGARGKISRGPRRPKKQANTSTSCSLLMPPPSMPLTRPSSVKTRDPSTTGPTTASHPVQGPSSAHHGSTDAPHPAVMGSTCVGYTAAANPAPVPSTHCGRMGGRKKCPAKAALSGKVKVTAVAPAVNTNCGSGHAHGGSGRSSSSCSRRGPRAPKARSGLSPEEEEKRKEKNRIKALKERERRAKSRMKLEMLKSTVREVCPGKLGPKASQQVAVTTLYHVLLNIKQANLLTLSHLSKHRARHRC